MKGWIVVGFLFSAPMESLGTLCGAYSLRGLDFFLGFPPQPPFLF